MARGRRGAEPNRRVAVVSKRGRFLVGELVFEQGSQLTLVGSRRIPDGGLALIELDRGRARVVRELGRPQVAADVIEALLADAGIRRGFSAGEEELAAGAVKAAADRPAPRRDLTDLPTFTVDPATARDFDDAVSAEETGDGGLRLWIHIADVAAHLRPGDPLDREARRRGNSVYVPNGVEPMLPHILSSDACSLTPGEVRLAVTAEIELSPAGEPGGERFYRSLIRSDARLNYDQLDQIFAGRRRAPEAAAAPLALARRAAAALAQRRSGGSLAVHSPEPEFQFDGGDVVGARSVADTEAHGLIEQLMILTNERVAALLERKRIPTVYRVHEQPDPEAVMALIEKLTALEIPTPPVPEHLAPRQAGEIARQASRMAAAEAQRRGHGGAAYTSLVLRSLKQAQYSERNLGHAGLGSPAYLHFTSPIRRYPDLIAHRGLLSVIGAGEERPAAEVAGHVAVECSRTEQSANRIERDADDICAAFLLQRELFQRGPGAHFEGEVSGVVGAGAFVRFGGELADVYEGFLPARVIGGRERYELDATETMLTGGRGGPAVRLGDPVSVSVERVEAPRGRVDLRPAEEGRR